MPSSTRRQSREAAVALVTLSGDHCSLSKNKVNIAKILTSTDCANCFLLAGPRREPRLTNQLRHAGPTTPECNQIAIRRCLERLVRRHVPLLLLVRVNCALLPGVGVRIALGAVVVRFGLVGRCLFVRRNVSAVLLGVAFDVSVGSKSWRRNGDCQCDCGNCDLFFGLFFHRCLLVLDV